MAFTSMSVVGQPSVLYVRRIQPSSYHQPGKSLSLASIWASEYVGSFAAMEAPWSGLDDAAAVDRQHLAGHVARRVGSEVHGRMGDVVRRAPAAQRDRLRDALLDALIEPAAVGGLDPAGAQYVDADVRRGRMGERTAERVDASLRGAEHLRGLGLPSACPRRA